MALITTTEAKVYLPNITGSTEDTTLSTLISRAGAMLAAACGYPAASVGGTPSMESTSYTLRLDGPGGTRLRLPVGPVTAVSSVYDDPDLVFGASTLLASTDYELDSVVGALRLLPAGVHGTWSTGEGVIKVTLTAGYVTVPEDLKHAAGLMVRHLFRGRREAGVESVSAGPSSVSPTTRGALPSEVRQAIQPFRLAYMWGAP